MAKQTNTAAKWYKTSPKAEMMTQDEVDFILEGVAYWQENPDAVDITWSNRAPIAE